MPTNTQKAQALAEKIAAQVRRGAGKGLNVARVFLAARVKETLSVPAPRAAVRGPVPAGKRQGPLLGYRATTRATPGAPPRKLSGRLRSSVSSAMLSDLTAVIGTNARGLPSKKYPAGFPYNRYHELEDPQWRGAGQHPYILPTVTRYRRELATLLGKEVKVTLFHG